MTGMRIACPNCSQGATVRDYMAVMSDGGTGTGTVVSTCRDCKGSGWLTHPGRWKPAAPKRGEAEEEGSESEQ